MFRRKAARAKATIDSLIGASMRLEGNVVFHGGLRIDGHVRGDVMAAPGAAGLLVIGERGRVDGDIVASQLIVSGTVSGTATISGAVELQPKARVSGEVRYRTLEVHAGALVEGILSHVDGDLVRPEYLRTASREPSPPAVADEAPATPR